MKLPLQTLLRPIADAGSAMARLDERIALIGPENAAATIACILEREGHINSAGGYLRDLTSKARRGELSCGQC